MSRSLYLASTALLVFASVAIPHERTAAGCPDSEAPSRPTSGAFLTLGDFQSVRTGSLAAPARLATDTVVGHGPPTLAYISDQLGQGMIGLASIGPVRPAMFQPEIVPEPVIQAPTPSSPATSTQLPMREVREAFGSSLTDRSMLADRSILSRDRRSLLFGPSIDFVIGSESKVLPVSFTGSLLGKASSVSGVQSIRRSPIVSDTRVRGKRVGQTLASGSFWVPARMDLDTMLSKIDARLIEDVVVIKGPYSAIYGPGLSFLDVQLMRTSRYSGGPTNNGSTSVDFQTNGNHWYGRQSFWGGSDNYGFHVGYGHRTGHDYISGDATSIPSSFKARDLYAAIGYDLDDERTVEVNYLRLDETDVEFPGQAFDIDFLVTDGVEFQFVDKDFAYFDRVTLDAWYNRTRFAGQAQSVGKRRQFPIFDEIDFEGNTDVDSMSTGFRLSATQEISDTDSIVGGVDLRYLNQELNEVTSADFSQRGFWIDANSPIPASHWSNPGLFAEYTSQINDRLQIRSGARFDWVSANLDSDETELAELGSFRPGRQPSFAEIVGTSEYDRDFALWSGYVSTEYKLNDCTKLLASGGHAQRTPTLTELYAAEPFMFLLQNGLNTVTGDPRLKKERAWQVDVGLLYRDEYVAVAVRGFHAWISDYITFENMGIEPASTAPEQVQLKFVNTDLAILAGAEIEADFDLTRHVTLFTLLSYVEGRDLRRNGHFSTLPVGGAQQPSVRVAGLRGASSGVRGAAAEPLPSVLPLDSRIGLRLHSPQEKPAYSVELSVRVVDGQDRVATSLLEQTTPGFAIWNVRSFWHVNEAITLMGGVENFGGRNYREHLDYRPITAGSSLTVLQPGATFYFGGEVRY